MTTEIADANGRTRFKIDPKPVVWRVNDAALIPWKPEDPDSQIQRVVALTEDGLPVAKKNNNSQFLRIGDEGWNRVGRFRRWLTGWKFVPNDRT